MSSSEFSNYKKHPLFINFQFQFSRIYSLGILEISKRITLKIISAILGFALLPFTIILYFAGFRRLLIFTDRIGHLAIEPDTLLKAQKLGLIKPKRWFILTPNNRVSNQHLLKYWKQYFSIYTSALSCFFLNCISLWPFMRYNVSHFINNFKNSQLTYEINKLWGERPPILRLTTEDNSFGDEQLALLGIPKDDWFVCVNAREGGFSPIDEALHKHRNSKVENLHLAIEEITRRGGWVIRLGDPSTMPLKEMHHVIDYAHHPLRSQRLDVILCARARFILGNTSGIFLVASVFGVPCALANMIPMSALAISFRDLSIPKLLRTKNAPHHLSFQTIMDSSISIYRNAVLYEKDNIEVEENTPEDILALTTEMLDRLDGKFLESEENNLLHLLYLSLFKPEHYSYGAASRVCLAFLRRYQHLLLAKT